jgi:3-carboxy-cis,cis-muconate cycloisomerase
VSEQGGLFAGIFGRGGVDVSDAAWLQAMLDTEAALARALERAGLAAAGAGEVVTAAAQAGNFDPGELGRQATLTGNPVPALVRALTAMLPASAAAAVHQGATSQDIIDTAMMLLARAALDATLASLSGAAAAAARLAAEHRDTVMTGRTLLQQAVPVTFGLVAAGWLTGIDEARTALAAVRRERLAVQFGGAAGTLAALGETGPGVAALLAAELGLAEPVLPWHTNRVRIVELAAALAGASAAVGKIARDVTLLAQTEVAEVREGTGTGAARGGSSAMPHKRNPVAAIATLGCTRQVPGLLATVTASAEQELQRAAGAWHAEWQPLSALLRLTGAAASWCAEMLAGLQADAAVMRANLDAAGGLPLAEHVTAVLAPRLGRLAAHDLVAEAAARSASTGRPFRDELLSDDRVSAGPASTGRVSAGPASTGRASAGPAGAGRASAGPDGASDGLTAKEIDAALDPSGYLGAAAEFVRRALAAHEETERALARLSS